jgi:hypothetical protein
MPTIQNPIIEQCKDKLRAHGRTRLLIPEPIEDLSMQYPGIICNDITQEMAVAILNEDIFLVKALTHLGGLINDDIHNFLSEVSKQEPIMIHHFAKGSYLTSIVQFKYDWNGTIVSEHHGAIGCENVIAITRVFPMTQFLTKPLHDNSHKVFTALAKRMWA